MHYNSQWRRAGPVDDAHSLSQDGRQFKSARFQKFTNHSTTITIINCFLLNQLDTSHEYVNVFLV